MSGIAFTRPITLAAGNFYTDTARLTERMTMIDPDVIHYEVVPAQPPHAGIQVVFRGDVEER